MSARDDKRPLCEAGAAPVPGPRPSRGRDGGPKGTATRGDQGRLAVFLGIILAATGLLCFFTLRGWSWGVKDQWQWYPAEFLGGAIFLPFIPLAVALACLPILLRWHRTGRPTRGDTVLTVIVLIVITFALQMAVWFVEPEAVTSAAVIVISLGTTSYFTYAYARRSEGLSPLLSHYVEIMRGFRAHARTHPPGPLLFFWAVQRLTAESPRLQRTIESATGAVQAGGFASVVEAPRQRWGVNLPPDTVAAAILSAFLLPFLGSLSVVLVYFLARLLHGSQAALLAGCCAATIPSLLLFAPAVDQLVTVLAAAALLALCSAGLRGSALRAAAAGIILALGAFVSLSALALVPLGGLWLALSPSKRRLWVALAWAGGFVAFFLILFAVFRFDFWAVVTRGIGAHRNETTQVFPRTYSKWVFWNLVDAAFFLGVPLALWVGRAALGQLWGAARRTAAMDPFLVALLATVLALDVSGLVRGEAGRLWMFLMLPAAVPAGAALARAGRGVTLAAITTLAMQVVQVLVFKEVLSLFVVSF